MMGNETKEIFDTAVSLVVAPNRPKMEESIYKIMKLAEASGFRQLYVSSTMPGLTIRETCDKNNFKNGLIIDTITRQLSGTEQPKEVPGCAFIDSPENLTAVHMQISSILNESKNVLVIIDSITTFLIYNSENSMLRFIHSISSLVREKSAKAVFFMVRTENVKQAFFDELQGFTDRVFAL